MHRSTPELPNDTLLHQLLIRPRTPTQRRRLRQLIARSKLARRPADPAKIDITIRVHRIKLLAQHRQAGAVGSSATSLSEDRLALVRPQPAAQRLERSDVVGCAGRVCAAAVRVEVGVDVEDEVMRCAVDVLDLGERRRGTVVDEGGHVRPVITWEEDGVGWVVGAGFADGGYSGLDGVCPGVDVDVVLVRVSRWSSPVSWIRGLTGSFIIPKATLGLFLYLLPSWLHRLAN